MTFHRICFLCLKPPHIPHHPYHFFIDLALLGTLNQSTFSPQQSRKSITLVGLYRIPIAAKLHLFERQREQKKIVHVQLPIPAARSIIPKTKREIEIPPFSMSVSFLDTLTLSTLGISPSLHRQVF